MTSSRTAITSVGTLMLGSRCSTPVRCNIIDLIGVQHALAIGVAERRHDRLGMLRFSGNRFRTEQRIEELLHDEAVGPGEPVDLDERPASVSFSRRVNPCTGVPMVVNVRSRDAR